MSLANPYAPYSSKREQRVVFFFVVVGIVALTYALFYVIDFLPEKPESSSDTQAQVESPENTGGGVEGGVESSQVRTDTTPRGAVAEGVSGVSADEALPVSIIFDTLDGRKVSVLNPKSATVEALDSALLSGAIRHPDSADFAHTGTIFLLGHSSYLPNVMNKNFQAFNGIQKMKWGDTIRLRSDNTEYIYSVDRVYQAKASDAEVKIQHDEARLILATCDSFATKDDRFIVEAVLVESHPLSYVGE